MVETVWTVYKTTHLESGKFYVGVHKTRKPDDRYLGSGKLIGWAVKAHGRDAFKKEILFTFDNPEEAYGKEAELVTEAFAARSDTYNLMQGGAIVRTGREGSANSQHGTRWVHRGGEAKKIPAEELEAHLSEGWAKGRGEAFREKMQEFPPTSKGTGGRIAVNKNGETRFVLPEDLEIFLRRGWSKGIAMSEEARKKVACAGRKNGHSHKGRCKLSSAKQEEVRRLYATGEYSTWKLAPLFNVSQPTVLKIVMDCSSVA